jgi:hypothetical protein
VRMPLRSLIIFTTTVYYISRMVSKGCTRVQYTAREYCTYTENSMSAVMKRWGGGGVRPEFFPPQDNIRLHGGETFKAGRFLTISSVI